MAEFNPAIQEQQAPDFTGASRGTGPNKAFEALFSGLGDAIESGAATADQFVQNNIEDDARYGFDALNDENNLSSDTVPSELTRSSEGLSKLAMAHNQGKVTSEYYYQRLSSQLKALRAKYPGYEKEVDDIVMNVTGTRPANAFRDALMANIENVNRATASAQDKFDSWVTQSGNIGYIQMAFPDYFDNPGKYTEQEVYSGVAKLKGQDQTFESQKSQMAGNKAFADQALNERLNQQTSSLLTSSSRALGMSGADFTQKLNAFATKGGGTPEELAAFTNTYEQFISAARTQMIKTTSDPVFQKLYSPSELKTMREDALQPLIQIRDMITQGQYSEAAQIVARNEYLQNKALSEMVKADPNLLAASALSKISPDLADYFAQETIKNQGGPAGYSENVAITDIMKSIVTGDDTINAANKRLVDAKNIPAAEKNKLAGKQVTQFTSLLKSGKLTPEELGAVVRENYSGGDDDLFKAVDSSTDARGNSQYLRLYNEMFSPEITKSIVDSGDQEALKKYTDEAVNKFQAIPEFRKAAADLTENIEYSKYLRAKYDPGSNRIILEANQEAIDNLGFFTKGEGNYAGEKFQLKAAVKAKDAFNQALAIMSPIIEAGGGDETEGVKALMRNVALDLQPDQKRGFFAWLNEGLDAITQPDPRNGSGFGADSALGKVAQRRAAEMDAAESESNFKEIGASSTDELDDDPILWDVPEDSQPDVISEVMGAAQGKASQWVSNYAPEGRSGNAALDAIEGNLVTSTKRGYQPDLDGLDSGFKQSVGALQNAFGKELPIVSGYRDPQRNRKAGGAKKSRHMHGDAVDIDASNMTREERIELIKLARQQGFGGVGIYANSIHLDKGARRSWGPNYRNSSLPKWARDALEG